MRHVAGVAVLLLFVMVSGGYVAHAEEGFTVLWVWDPPFAYGNPEFQQARDVLSSLGGRVVAKSAWEVWLLRDTGWEGWLRGAGYDLVVVAWARPGCQEAVARFMVEALGAGVPVLFLPAEGWNATAGLGLVMRDASLFDANFSVAVDELTEGVLVSCVSGRVGVVSVFERVNVSAPGVSLRPLVLVPSSGALAVAGVVNGTRFAAVAPYLYASECGDNRRLLENLVLWLLGRWPRERVEELPWGSVAVRDLAGERKKLLGEIERLRMEKKGLEEELARLRGERNAALAEIEKLRAQLRELRGAVNATAACGGGSGLGSVALAAGAAAAGYLAAVAVGRRLPGARGRGCGASCPGPWSWAGAVGPAALVLDGGLDTILEAP